MWIHYTQSNQTINTQMKKKKRHNKNQLKSKLLMCTSIKIEIDSQSIFEASSHAHLTFQKDMYIDEKDKLIGSVLYETAVNNELLLTFFSAEVLQDQTKPEVTECSQQPIQQAWVIDYPILVYKTISPENNEIAIVHLA